MDMNNYYYQPQQVGQPYFNSYDPIMYGTTAMGYNQIPTPANKNALTDEEISILKSNRPSNNLVLAIDRDDVIRSMCTHKDNGRDVVVMLSDGSGKVYCPICGKTWTPEMKERKDVEALVAELLDQMQCAKWTGDLPVDLTRELFTLMPLLEKYPEIHEYAMKTFNKYVNAHSMHNAAETSLYGMYNSLFSTAPVYGYNAPAYGAPMQAPVAQQGYYNQPTQGYAPANAMVNPMQAPTYGVNPIAPNQQFVSQANMMMGGTVAPMYGTPVYGAPMQAPVAQQDVNAAAAPATTDATVTSETKIEL